jgi:hypothetical protein
MYNSQTQWRHTMIRAKSARFWWAWQNDTFEGLYLRNYFESDCRIFFNVFVTLLTIFRAHKMSKFSYWNVPYLVWVRTGCKYWNDVACCLYVICFRNDVACCLYVICFLRLTCVFLKCLSGKADLTVLADNRISIKQRREGLRGSSTI